MKISPRVRDLTFVNLAGNRLVPIAHQFYNWKRSNIKEISPMVREFLNVFILSFTSSFLVDLGSCQKSKNKLEVLARATSVAALPSSHLHTLRI